MQVPQIEKITLNMGVGDAKTNSKLLDAAMEQMSHHRRPAPVHDPRTQLGRRRSSCARSMPIGCKVTLRGERMYEFLDRLLTIALPRIRDFRGIKATAFDKQGNYALGITEQTIFPEIDYDTVDTTRGLDVVFTIKTASRRARKLLLDKFGFPFRKPGQQA